MASLALEKSRELRHRLETVESMDMLEDIAVETEEFFKWLNREWASKRLETCPTCKIKPSGKAEPKPKKDYGEYGKTVADARKKLMDEIIQARGGLTALSDSVLAFEKIYTETPLYEIFCKLLC